MSSDKEPISIGEYFFPPPWNINEFPEKTEGWIEFQKALKKDPAYYLMDLPNVKVENVK